MTDSSDCIIPLYAMSNSNFAMTVSRRPSRYTIGERVYAVMQLKKILAASVCVCRIQDLGQRIEAIEAAE